MMDKVTNARTAHVIFYRKNLISNENKMNYLDCMVKLQLHWAILSAAAEQVNFLGIQP